MDRQTDTISFIIFLTNAADYWLTVWHVSK